MPSDETRRLLKLFGVAVTSLEDAIDGKAPMDEIMKWDQEVAERMRELGLFATVQTEIGQIIVGQVDRDRVAALVAADHSALDELIRSATRGPVATPAPAGT